MRAAAGLTVLAAAAAVLGATSEARAQEDRAVVNVGEGYAGPPPRYAEPPPIAADEPPAEDYRSPLRFHLGPVGASTGRGLGLGLGLAADFGRGSVGFRLGAAWMRGEPSGGDPSPIADGLSQYTGELTLDLRKRGPLHPVLGFGFGLARVARGDTAGNLGVGTMRFGLEYALGLEDADVRVAGGLTGVLPGPADREVADVKGWGLAGVAIAIGF